MYSLRQLRRNKMPADVIHTGRQHCAKQLIRLVLNYAWGLLMGYCFKYSSYKA
jgi:hypothetical protein